MKKKVEIAFTNFDYNYFSISISIKISNISIQVHTNFNINFYFIFYNLPFTSDSCIELNCSPSAQGDTH